MQAGYLKFNHFNERLSNEPEHKKIKGFGLVPSLLSQEDREKTV